MLNFFKNPLEIDPLDQPKVTAGRDHCFRTCCPSVRPSPLFKSRKTKQQKTMFATGETLGLAEWILDDTCPVVLIVTESLVYHLFAFHTKIEYCVNRKIPLSRPLTFKEVCSRTNRWDRTKITRVLIFIRNYKCCIVMVRGSIAEIL